MLHQSLGLHFSQGSAQTKTPNGIIDCSSSKSPTFSLQNLQKSGNLNLQKKWVQVWDGNFPIHLAYDYRASLNSYHMRPMMDVSREHSSQCSYRRPQIHPSYQLNLPGARVRARWSSSPMMAALWFSPPNHWRGTHHSQRYSSTPRPVQIQEHKPFHPHYHHTSPEVKSRVFLLLSQGSIVRLLSLEVVSNVKIRHGQGLWLASLRILWRPPLPSISFLLRPLSGGNNNRDWKAHCIWPSATPSFFSRTR